MHTFCKNYNNYIVLLLITFSQTVFAHNGSIQGNISQQSNGQPVSDALIYVTELSTTTFTNTFGNYTITDLPKGTYHLSIVHIGFEQLTAEITVTDATTSTANFVLAEVPISLEQVVVRSTQTDQMRAVNVLDIQLRPTENAQDLLRLVPGLFIAQHAGGGKAEQIFLRGFDIDHGTDISVNVDGIPVNMVSHAHGQGYADLHFLIPETVQSFDFLKGPYYAGYGDFATAAAVNFKTKNYLDNNTIKVSAGQFNTLRTLLMMQLPLAEKTTSKSSAYIAGEYQITDGPFASPQDFTRANIFGKYHTSIRNNTILQLSASTFSSRWNASGQVPQRAIDMGLIDRFGAIDDKEGGITSRSNVNIELIKSLNTNTDISNQIYFSDYQFELYSNFTFFLEDSINGDMIKQKEHRRLYGYKSKLSNETIVAGKLLNTEAGIGFRYDKSMENELSHVAERELLLNRLAYGNIYQTNAFVYINEKLQLTDRLAVNAALRYDVFNFAYNNLMDSSYQFNSVDDGILSYKLNFDYTINNNLGMYLHTGKGFHSNDSRVVVAQNTLQTLPAAYGADLGLQLKPYRNLILNPAVWVLYLEQEFVYVGDAAVVEAGGKTLRRGFDLSARWELTDWLFIDVDINYTLAELIGSPEGENYIPLAADLTSIGGVNIRTDNGWSGSLRYRYMDDRPANETGSVIAEGYFVNDAVINYTTKNYALGIEVQNLFNVDWNEAQFDTESRLLDEPAPVSELHFTPGTPFFAKGSVSLFF